MSDDILSQIGHATDNSEYSSANDFIISTLEVLPGVELEMQYGLVSGKMIVHRNPLREFIDGIQNYFGLKGSSLVDGLDDARTKAIEIMINQAKALGANSVIGLKFENLTISFSAIEVRVYGTAAKFVKY